MVCIEEDAASRHAAFDRLVTPEISRLHDAARVLTHGRQAAEDLVQDTLVRAYRALCRFDGRHPRAWLLTILRNAFYKDAVRRHDLPVADVPGRESDDHADAVAFDDALRRALDELPDSQRTVVELVDVAGLSYAEAAAVVDAPVGTVMSRLHRARLRLRKELLP